MENLDARITKNKFESLGLRLLSQWCEALLKYQLTHLDSPGLKGGLLSPAYGRIEGRCAEAVYPLLNVAAATEHDKYIDASILLMRWAQHNVCFPDGSWVNEVSVSDWRGVTVNAVIAMAEALTHYGSLLDGAERSEWLNQIKLSAEYVNQNFHIGFGNINYPIVASYALELAGQLLDEPRYRKRARKLAESALSFFTQTDQLLYGEGRPYDQRSPQGCLAVDLGYNVEESLPALALYGLLSEHNEVLDIVSGSLSSHLEFMLPDGAWDNSWGTRNYKWTYWGSRNADGCQPAYALLADKNPAFLEAAHRNLLLLEACTHDGILQGGPHNAFHGELASLHHTFCHAKGLATVLDYGIPKNLEFYTKQLPREKGSRIVTFKDIRTFLISAGEFRATISNYDWEFLPDTHVSGGTLSMLWHTLTGPILCAGISEYRLIEEANMQMDKDPYSMSLAPRLELRSKGQIYRTSSDLKANTVCSKNGEKVECQVLCHLVDGDQDLPADFLQPVNLSYTISPAGVVIRVRVSEFAPSGQLNFFLPLISKGSESIRVKSAKEILIKKEQVWISVSSNQNIEISKTGKERIFNFVPGLEALPLRIELPTKTDLQMEILIKVII